MFGSTFRKVLVATIFSFSLLPFATEKAFAISITQDVDGLFSLIFRPDNSSGIASLSDVENSQILVREYKLGLVEKVLSESPLGFDFVSSQLTPLEKKRPRAWVETKLVLADKSNPPLARDILASIDVDQRRYSLRVLQSDVLKSGRMETLLGVFDSQNRIFAHKCVANLTSSPFHTFYEWGKKWILECSDDVFVDGEKLSVVFGYDKIFDYRPLNGKPFFFFGQSGKYGISYDGKPHHVRYDTVIHYLCCEPSVANPKHFLHFTSFVAVRGDNLFYVEAGINTE